MSETMMNFADLLDNNEQMKPLNELIEQIMELPEEGLTEQTIEMLSGMIAGAITPAIKEESIKNMILGFEEMGHTKASARDNVEDSKNEIRAFVDSLAPSQNKRILLEKVFAIFFDIFDAAVERYHSVSIELPIQLDEGAQVPTYAHDTDAAADLYAYEDVVVAAHSYGNMIKTGIRIGLPEGWVAFILPRSSIGAKTPLRLSNSVGVIDAGYRGQVCALFDNISDADYEIKKGDRIAQLLIRPNYQFKPVVVDELDRTERGEGGFGSTGA